MESVAVACFMTFGRWSARWSGGGWWPSSEVASAVKVLVERARVVAEGAGAVPVAAALAGRAGRGRVVCVVSGGNIDSRTLIELLSKP